MAPVRPTHIPARWILLWYVACVGALAAASAAAGLAVRATGLANLGTATSLAGAAGLLALAGLQAAVMAGGAFGINARDWLRWSLFGAGCGGAGFLAIFTGALRVVSWLGAFGGFLVLAALFFFVLFGPPFIQARALPRGFRWSYGMLHGLAVAFAWHALHKWHLDWPTPWSTPWEDLAFGAALGGAIATMTSLWFTLVWSIDKPLNSSTHSWHPD